MSDQGNYTAKGTLHRAEEEALDGVGSGGRSDGHLGEITPREVQQPAKQFEVTQVVPRRSQVPCRPLGAGPRTARRMGAGAGTRRDWGQCLSKRAGPRSRGELRSSGGQKPAAESASSSLLKELCTTNIGTTEVERLNCLKMKLCFREDITYVAKNIHLGTVYCMYLDTGTILRFVKDEEEVC